MRSLRSQADGGVQGLAQVPEGRAPRYDDALPVDLDVLFQQAALGQQDLTRGQLDRSGQGARAGVDLRDGPAGDGVLAVQRVMGLLPEWRSWSRGGGASGPVVSGPTLGNLYEADAFKISRIGGSIGSRHSKFSQLLFRFLPQIRQGFQKLNFSL